MIRRIKEIVKRSGAFRAWANRRVRRDEMARFMAEARAAVAALPDGDAVLGRYERDLKRYMFTFDEWHNMYCLDGAAESRKREFISRSEAQKWYRRLIKPEVRMLFHSKPLFLNTFAGGVNRVCRIVDKTTTVEQLRDMLAGRDVIVKPQKGSLGQGVRKICRGETASIDFESLLEQCRREECIVEECISGCEEMQRFHPASLNTIRIVTAFDGRGVRLFGSFVRFGRGGSVIDNAHGGGVYCTVDISTGTVCTDAHDTDGNVYAVHPDSKIAFKGFRLPHWEEMTRLCMESHAAADIPFVGWDVCVTSDGGVEFIEGNHAPDMDIIQGPLQRGCREDFLAVCKGYNKFRR